MRTILIIVSVITLVLALGACEDVIDVDLNDSESQLVIEAVILDSMGGNFVKITRSANFYDNNNFPTVNGVVADFRDSQGNVFPLFETMPGYYTNSSLTGQYGEEYTFTATVDGTVITASTIMQSKVKYDSLIVEEDVTSFGDEGDYRVRVYFTDKANEANYYKMNIYENGVKEDDTALLDDRIFDGKSTSFPIFFYGYDIGDTVRVDLFTIDELAFKYFTALASNADGGFFSAAPGNPDGNYNTDILGYFGAFSGASETVVIQ